ncbi:MAG TPA: BTAD domain-containing putative transcriptional regulator [Microthrixaceae bacterium]|nr:BTAD domain-containing putative transcriptional regulator [Microthrixaceae bacterium]
MRLAVLGPVVLAADDGGVVPITPRKAREVLAILALEHPRPLSLDALAARLWDEPPPAAAKTVQGLLSRLRRALVSAGAPEPGIAGGPVGYTLVFNGDLDVAEFERLVRAGRQWMQTATWTLASDALAEALDLFRGPPELPATTTGASQQVWLNEHRAGVAEDHVEARINAGHLDAAIAELELLIAAHPFRERLWELRMTALARAGRTAEALRTFAEARAALVEQVGIEPGEGLRRLEQELLDGRTPPIVPARPVSTPPATERVGDAASGPIIHYVPVDDVHIAWCSIGEGEDLVIINPGTMPADCMRTEPRLADALDGLTSFARVTWFDRRGIGLSDRCTADHLPTVSDWVRDLEAVLDAVGATAPVVYACEDATAVVLHLAVQHPERLAGIVLSNAHARFTRAEGYPHGWDPLLAAQSASEVSAAEPVSGGVDLLTVIAPSVAGDAEFRAWWDNSGRRGASPQVALALRDRHQNSDLRDLVARVTVPVLHLVNPTAPAHDPGHDRYLDAHMSDIETHALPGPDELWWLDASGSFASHVERFTRHRSAAHRLRHAGAGRGGLSA